jgi:hypothetical protein
MDGQIGQAIVTPDDYHHRQEAAWNTFLEKKEKSWVVSCWTPRRRNDDIHGPPTRDVWKAVGHPPPPNVICAATHRWKREKLKNSGGPLDFFIGILFSSLIIKTTTQIQKFKRGIGRGGKAFLISFPVFVCWRSFHLPMLRSVTLTGPNIRSSQFIRIWPGWPSLAHEIGENSSGARSPVWLRHFISGRNQIPLKSPFPLPLARHVKI